MLCLFLAVDLLTPLLLLLALLVAIPLTGVRVLRLTSRVWPLLGLALAIGLVNVVFGVPRGPMVAALGPVSIHAGTLMTGAALGVRIFAIALAGVAALATADPTDLADALMQQLHVSPRFALGALAAVRLLPALSEEWQLLRLARRARGLSASSPQAWVRIQLSLLMGLLVSAIRRATRLALAMEARGLGSGRVRSVARPQAFTRLDAWLLTGAVLSGAVATAVSLAAGSYRFLFG
jgi:energy-coupling factor transport system permease protein